MDTAALLSSELVIQNGICRLVDDGPTAARYYLFHFRYTAESDERHNGACLVGVNGATGSLLPGAITLLRAIQDGVEDDPGFQVPRDTLAKLYPVAFGAAKAEIQPLLSSLRDTANRRLKRDSERVESYYRGLLAQIKKRVQRRATDPEAAEKEQSRAAATELDRAAKLEDLTRKYSIRVHLELTDILTVSLPVREIRVRLIRKKEERLATLYWNTLLRELEQPLCEHCRARAHPLYLCDKVHSLCRNCWTTCPHCNRTFCRACQPRCKCGASAS